MLRHPAPSVPRRRPRSSVIAVAFVAAAGLSLAVTPADARRGGELVALEFEPQRSVAEVVPPIEPGALAVPVALAVVDARPEAVRGQLGLRTDGSNRRTELEAVGEVGAFVRSVVDRVAEEAGILVDPGAERRLTIEIARFRVLETGRALRATYSAQVELDYRLTAASGARLWSAEASGDATLSGRKSSLRRIREVLSDALLLALGDGLGARELHRAWAAPAPGEGVPGPLAEAPDPRTPVAPSALLTEVEVLLGREVAPRLLVAFLGQRTLAAPFSAVDLVAWQEAGVPEEILEAALALPVR